MEAEAELTVATVVPPQKVEESDNEEAKTLNQDSTGPEMETKSE